MEAIARYKDFNKMGLSLFEQERKDHIRVRKLTPLEKWRLMGFSDKAFSKAKAIGVSDTQLYKQAGNSIVVDVLMEIFRKLYK